MQVLTYEACNCSCTSSHMPKRLDMRKKSTHCLIKKASRCAVDCTSKTMFLIFHCLKTQRSYNKTTCFYLLFHWFNGEKCIIITFSLHKGRQISTD